MKSFIYYFLSFALLLGIASCGEGTISAENQGDTEGSPFIEVSQAQFDQLAMEMGSIKEMSFPISVSVNGMIDVPPGK
ncbi:hypothetical protein NYZ99_07895 [Maribacter litopenaei]|uniref:Uncharacterized protein n=1 Tax=Maribacter litopenaei TaxID=2976127 RepID=A0ABY5YB90_9FLAO|nr:hypothetical protein [Maribacter litopenaei]UWX56179.1 hypothetical protein NYZ99_07895 [Maribacter litopenaei]